MRVSPPIRDSLSETYLGLSLVFDTLRNWLVCVRAVRSTGCGWHSLTHISLSKFKLSLLEGTYDVDGKARRPADRPRGAHSAANSRQVSPSSVHSRDGSAPPRDVARFMASTSAARQASTQASTSAAAAPRKRPLADAPAPAAKRTANVAGASGSPSVSMFSAGTQKPLPKLVPPPRALSPGSQARKDAERWTSNQAKLIKSQVSCARCDGVVW